MKTTITTITTIMLVAIIIIQLMAVYWQSKAIKMQKYNLCVQIHQDKHVSKYALEIYQKYNCEERIGLK